MSIDPAADHSETTEIDSAPKPVSEAELEAQHASKLKQASAGNNQEANQPLPMTPQNKDDDAVDQKQQPFLEHIVELRSRILRSLGFVAVLFCQSITLQSRYLPGGRPAHESFARRRRNDCDTSRVAFLGALQARHLRCDFCRRAVLTASTLVVRITRPIPP